MHDCLKTEWNSGHKNEEVIGNNGINQIDLALNEDILSAKWVRDVTTTVNNIEFDLSKNNYNILLAKGPIDANSKKLIKILV